MKKWFKYIFLLVFLFLGIKNVGAVSKVWSCGDGLPSSVEHIASNENFEYPYSIRKYKDSITDSLDEFKDSDTNDDYYIYYYRGDAYSYNLYYTKLTQSVKSGSDTIYYGDIMDNTYNAFLFDMRDQMSPSGNNYEGFFPILVVHSIGTPTVHYVNAGWNLNNINPTDIQNNLKNWKNLTDYTSDLVQSYNGLVKGYEDKTGSTKFDNDCGNALDDAGEEVAETGEDDQRAGHDTTEEVPVKSDLTCENMGDTLVLIRQIYNVLRFLIPILIIGLSIVDFAKVIINGEEKVFKEAWTKFAKRVAIGIIILILPIILSMVIKMSGALDTYGISSDNYFCIFK